MVVLRVTCTIVIFLWEWNEDERDYILWWLNPIWKLLWLVVDWLDLDCMYLTYQSESIIYHTSLQRADDWTKECERMFPVSFSFHYCCIALFLALELTRLLSFVSEHWKYNVMYNAINTNKVLTWKIIIETNMENGVHSW